MKCTDEFQQWFQQLDKSLQIRIDQRLQLWQAGTPGLHKRFDGLLEIKWRTGTMGSFRVYCAEVDGEVLLLGGHKDSQSKDIREAKRLLEGVRDGKTKTRIHE